MLRVHIPYLNLPLIMDSGQCFRMKQIGKNTFQLIAGGRLLTIKEDGAEHYLFDCGQDDFEHIWREYLDLSRDYGAILEGISEGDPFLMSAKAFGKGLRILRQEPFETLISFIISQRKTIPAIRTCVENLARSFGKEIASKAFAFPSAETLAAQPLDALKACGLGYRAPYVLKTAQMVASRQIDLEALRLLSDKALMDALMAFPGVGEKVAGCVMLFGYARFDAFPRDVWINRVIDQVYQGRFDLSPYKGHAGFIQQLMFVYGRSPAFRDMQEYKERTIK